jgi:hypothetical protein
VAYLYASAGLERCATGLSVGRSSYVPLFSILSVRMQQELLHVVWTSCLHLISLYSKTSLIQANLEWTPFQITESPNYRSATENMFKDVVKWTF